MEHLFDWFVIIAMWWYVYRLRNLHETVDAVSTHRFADRYQLEWVTEQLIGDNPELREAANNAWYRGWDEWKRRKKAGEV